MATTKTFPTPTNELERDSQIKFAERIKAMYDSEGETPESYPPYKLLLEHLERLKRMVLPQ